MWQEEKEANRAIENMLRTFWLQNYDLESDHGLDSSEAYDHFISMSKQIKPTITFEQFKTSSGHIADLRIIPMDDCVQCRLIPKEVYLLYKQCNNNTDNVNFELF